MKKGVQVRVGVEGVRTKKLKGALPETLAVAEAKVTPIILPHPRI